MNGYKNTKIFDPRKKEVQEVSNKSKSLRENSYEKQKKDKD